MVKKMNAKNLMVSFVAIVVALFLVTTVFAGEIVEDNYVVIVDDMDAYANEVGVIAGETITIEVYFKALNDDTDVTVKAELEGEKVEFEAETAVFDVEAGKSYRKILKLEVPYELKDEISDNVFLNIELDGKEHKTELPEIILRVQRPSYDVKILSISTSTSVDAGDIFSVEVVLRNIGYNDLDDLYVTASLSLLGVEKTSFIGDLVAVEDDDNDDTVSGRFYLKVPYNAQPGIYTLEVEVTNDDMTVSKSKQIIVNNDFPETVIVTSTRKIVATGEDAQYSLLLVNPTNKLKVYRIVTESSGNLVSSANTAVVAVPGGLSKTVYITANARAPGEYNFNVNIFSGEELVSTVTLSMSAEGKSTNPIAVLTIILAIVFLVLLVVLIVLIGKKPEKTEEFGESYY